MDLSQLKAQFQILFEDLATNGSKGLDDSEISTCLTVSNENIVRSLIMTDPTALAEAGLIEELSYEVPADPALAANQTYKRAYDIKHSFLEDNQTTPKALPSKDFIAIISRVAYELVVDKVTSARSTKDIPLELTPVPTQVVTAMNLKPYKYPPKDIAYVLSGEKKDIVFFPLNFYPGLLAYRIVLFPTAITLKGALNPYTGGEEDSGVEPQLPVRYHDAILQGAVQYAIRTYIGQQEQSVDNGSTGAQ